MGEEICSGEEKEEIDEREMKEEEEEGPIGRWIPLKAFFAASTLLFLSEGSFLTGDGEAGKNGTGPSTGSSLLMRVGERSGVTARGGGVGG